MEKGGNNKNMAEDCPAHMPEFERASAIHRPVHAHKSILVLQRLSAFRLGRERALRSLSRSPLSLLSGRWDYIRSAASG